MKERMELNKKIKIFEENLNNIKEIKDLNKEKENNKIIKNIDNDFNIKLKNPIHILNNHTKSIFCLSILNDGRLVSGSYDKSIIIYNKITYKPDLIIKEHNSFISCITQLSSGILASCSGDKIKLFNINNYKILQTLNYHNDAVNKIIELKNKYLVSCSIDNSIIFYYKNNSKYIKDFQISTKGRCYCIIETKENEICYSDYEIDTICFYDLNEKKIKSKLLNINTFDSCRLCFIIRKDLLIIPGINKISIIDINKYKLIRIIDISNSGDINGICLLNENILLTGDESNSIKQWRIEVDNLILISTKENAHNNRINVLLNIGEGHIASCSDDKKIKIW